MLAFAAICLLAGILPGLCIDALSAVTQSLVGAHMPVQAALPWLSIVPIAESRSSYNGLLVFAFIAVSTIVTVEVIHRFASRAVRRAPAWDCGYPDANPATQYTADSFAQPIRRVFGEVVFKASERVDMPAPGDMRPAHIHVKASSGKSPILTTQLYFKGDPWINNDAGVRPSLIMSPRRESEGLVAKFDFVIKAG